MALFAVILAKELSGEESDFLNTLKNLNARKLNDTTWMVNLSSSFPAALGGLLAEQLNDNQILTVLKVDGMPCFYKCDHELTEWAERCTANQHP